MNKIDALIAVLSSGTPEFVEACPSPPTPNLAGPFTESVNSTPLHLPQAAAVTTPLDMQTKVQPDDEIFCLRQKASSAKNFAVLLVRKLFEPHELDGRNVRGVGKPALDIARIKTIQELVYKHYPTLSAQRECLWRDCRKAVDTLLRNRKLGGRNH